MDIARDALDGDVARKILLYVRFGGADFVVVVRSRHRQDGVARLIGSGHVEEQRLGALQRDLVTAEFLDEVETEVDRGVDAAATKHPPIFGDESFRMPVDLGVAPAEIVGDGPMGCRLSPVEETGLGKIGGAGAGASNMRALGRFFL